MYREEYRAGRRPDNPLPVEEPEIGRLIIRCKRGDAVAFAELMRRYRKQVAALAYRISGDYDDAADITQAVFLKMAFNIQRFDERRKFYTWLYRITMNCAIDHFRRSRRFRHESLEAYQDNLVAQTEAPEMKRRREELARHLQEATGTLSSRQRSAFVLREVEGCRVNDVAAMMEVPEATVRWYLHRARGQMRKEMLRRCPQLLMLFGIR